MRLITRLSAMPASQAALRAVVSFTAASVIASSSIGAATAAGASDAVLSSVGIPGIWSLKETRAGNLCEAQAAFIVDDPGSLEGGVTVRSPCFDTGKGAWKLVLDGDKPTFGWALDFEKSRVFYSTTSVEAARPGGTVKAKGLIQAVPRSADPGAPMRPIGTFDAKAKLKSAQP